MPGWLSQLSLRLLIFTQVMISWFVRSNPMSGSVLTAKNLLGILSHLLYMPLLYLCFLFFSKINKLKELFKKNLRSNCLLFWVDGTIMVWIVSPKKTFWERNIAICNMGGPRGIILSEISRTEKDKYCMISYICGL